MKLFYRKFGEGPALIIVHGLYGSSDNWISIGKALSENFEVYIIDQRNHGNSPHTKDHNYILLKNDLDEFMIQHGIAKAVLLGHSMGGKTVMFFAAEHPEKVESLIVIDISPRSYNDELPRSIEHRKIIDTMSNVDFTIVKKLSDIEKQLQPGIESQRIRRFLLKNVNRENAGDFSWKINLNTIRDQFSEIMDGMDQAKFMKGNGITGFPVLFIKGEKSPYISVEDISLIHTIFPAAEIVTIPSAGHWVHAEQPVQLLKTINYFVLGTT